MSMKNKYSGYEEGQKKKPQQVGDHWEVFKKVVVVRIEIAVVVQAVVVVVIGMEKKKDINENTPKCELA